MTTDDTYRTVSGAVLHDWTRGDRVVVQVWRSEDIHRFVDARCYRYRFADERSALHSGRRNGPMPARS